MIWLQFKAWCAKYEKLDPEQPDATTPYNIRDFLCNMAYVSSDDIKKRNESRKPRVGSSKDVQHIRNHGCNKVSLRPVAPDPVWRTTL